MSESVYDDRMDPRRAYETVKHFATSRGEVALRLAMHAAVPQTLRPDLLHVIKRNFVLEAFDEPSVEADVLFSPLCNHLGGGYYQFDEEIRQLLLDNLAVTYSYEPVLRVHRVAELLLEYIEQVERQSDSSKNRLLRNFLEVQRWVALSFLHPEAAAYQLAAALKQAEEESDSQEVIAARVQLGGVASAISIPLAHQRELLTYARGLQAIEMNDHYHARRLLEHLGDLEIEVGDIVLQAPREILEQRSLVIGEKSTEEEVDVEDIPEQEEVGATQVLETCRSVLRGHLGLLMNLDGVVATGVGYKTVSGTVTDELCIVCSVIKKMPVSDINSRDIIPATLDGIAIDVVQTGEIVSFVDPTGRFRPTPSGVSLGHVDITAGTLGCWVKRNGETFLLSNNHVIANSNNAAIGDPILQPGRFDGGQHPQDQIATLEEFVPLVWESNEEVNRKVEETRSGNFFSRLFRSQQDPPVSHGEREVLGNLVDAAIGRPLTQDVIENENIEFGKIAGIEEAQLGMSLQKYGRTTRFTTGAVQQIDVTVKVSYGSGLIAIFSDQILAGAMSQGGDSGSAVLNGEKNLVGLLFAGSNTVTLINRIQNVFSALNLTL